MVFKNLEIYIDNKLEKFDIEIKDGYISAIEKNIESSNYIDCRDSILLNGTVDLSVYPKDKKVSNVAKVQDRALESGFSESVIGADLEKLVDREESLNLLKSISRDVKSRFLFSGVDRDGNLSNIATLSKYGDAISISSDIDGNLLRRVFEYAQMLELPVFVNIESREINDNGLLHNTEEAFKLGLPTRHEIGEITEVAKIVELARLFKVKTLLRGVTEKRAIEIIESAKRESVQLFLELSIHHLIKDDSIYRDFNNYTKIEPPFQNIEGRDYLVNLLINGGVDFITAGHLEVSQSNKSGSFKDAQSGICGFDHPLSIFYTNFVKSGKISVENFIELFSSDKKLFKSEPLKVGTVPSFTVFKRSESIKIENRNSIYYGESFSGKVIATVSKGTIFRYGM